jgi:hypothetical protein
MFKCSKLHLLFCSMAPNIFINSVDSLTRSSLSKSRSASFEFVSDFDIRVSNFYNSSIAPVMTIFINAAGISTFHPRAIS